MVRILIIKIFICEPSFPDDKFNRMWQPFKDQNPAVASHSNVTSSDFWNLPPNKAFSYGITTSRGKTLEIQWPPVSLPSTMYYISLYFHENRSPSPFSWRVFDVSINGHTFFSNLNATTKGVTVYAAQWPLSGKTKVTLTPSRGMPVGPVINAGEVYQILPLGGRTQTRDGKFLVLLFCNFLLLNYYYKATCLSLLAVSLVIHSDCNGRFG